jgi:hypothetical protein
MEKLSHFFKALGTGLRLESEIKGASLPECGVLDV